MNRIRHSKRVSCVDVAGKLFFFGGGGGGGDFHIHI